MCPAVEITPARVDWAFQAGNPASILSRLLHRGPFFYIWISLLYLIKHSSQWLIIYTTARLIDSLANPGSMSGSTLIILGTFTLISIALNIPFHTLFIDTLSEAARNLERGLRLAVASRLQQLSISFHQRSESGRLQAKMLRDVEQIQLMCMELGSNGLGALMTFFVAAGYAAWNQPRMLLLFALVCPVTVLISRQFRTAIRSRNTNYRHNLERMNSYVVEMVEMLPLTRAHAVEEAALNGLSEHVHAVKKHGRMLDRINAMFNSTSWVIIQLFSFGVLLAGYWFVRQGWISIGDLVLYQVSFSMLVGSINQFLNLFPLFNRGAESINSLGEVLRSPDLEHNAGKAAPATVQGSIVFEDVTFRYPGAGQPAISNFTLSIPEGRTLALVGRSGSGKSTIINLAIGFLRAQRGHIYLDGRDMESIDMRAWRTHLSLVPQQIVLFNGTIRENLLFGLPRIEPEFFEKVLKLTHVTEFTERLPEGVETNIGGHGSLLSGGQKQRIAIARALMRNPRVIVLDEPTSALDLESEHLVQDALKILIKNRTTIIVAHRLSTIRNADLICVMREGRIEETGTYEKLLSRKNGAFQHLHEISLA